RVDEVFLELGIFPLVVNLFFEYPWNNCLHECVARMLVTVLENPDETYQCKVLEECKLVERIIATSNEKESSCSYLGFLTALSRRLEVLGQSESGAVAGLLRSNEKWKEYVNGKLKERKLKEDTLICGYDPKKSAGPPGG